MMVMSHIQMAQDDLREPRRLLTPSLALGSFNPRRGMIAGLKPVLRQRVRYGFRIGELGFLIGADTVSEVVEQATVYPVPQTPPWLAGIVNLRGNLVPVFDLQRCLEFKVDHQEKRYLLVLDKGDDAIGLFIENLPQLMNANHKLAHPPPLPAVLRGHVAMVYGEDKIIWVEFDHRGFFQSLATRMTAIT